MPSSFFFYLFFLFCVWHIFILSDEQKKFDLSSCIMWKLQYGWLRKHLYATISFDVLLKKKKKISYNL